MNDSAPRNVLVTGAASGIGASIAARFHGNHDRVAGLDVDGEGLDGAALDSRVVCDVRDESATKHAVDTAADELGGIDVVVNAAGVAGRGTVADLTVEEWNRVFEINVRGLFLVARHAIPHLRRSDRATIINVASQLGVAAAPDAAAYCASKAAAIHLTRAMAVDHAADGITVNAVCPGPTSTPMLESYFSASEDPEAEKAAFRQTMLTGRFVEPDEVAAAVFYLAQDDARSTTGAALLVDGGYVVR